MSDVFFSHSSKNKATADALVAALEKEGLGCWIAPRDIAAGDNYGAAIAKGIRECKVLLLVFSEDSNVSAAVFREVQMGFNERKAIIPVRIENVAVSDDLSFFLSSLHWVDVSPNEQSFDDLIPDVRSACERYHEGQDNPNPVSSKRPRPAKKMAASTRNALITVSSIVACFIIALTAFFIINSQTVNVSVFLTLDAATIRIDLDQDNIVQDIVSLAAVDERLIAGLLLQSLPQAVSDLVYRALDIGIIDKGAIISTSIEAPDEVLFASVSNVLTDINTDLTERLNVSLVIDQYINDTEIAEVVQPPGYSVGDTIRFRDNAVYVRDDGTINMIGWRVNNSASRNGLNIRPALWLNLTP